MPPIQGDDGLSGFPIPANYGVKGESAGNLGVLGLSGGRPLGVGVYGQGSTYGVHGASEAIGVSAVGYGEHGRGVYAINQSGAGTVFAQNTGSGPAVEARSTQGSAVVAQIGTWQPALQTSRAVYALASGDAQAAIEARHVGKGWAVWGVSDVIGGIFQNNINPHWTNSAYFAMPTKAGWFDGDVIIFGSFQVGGGKSFLIDHPMDPANKYLEHSSVESDERKNVYDGIAVLGENGEAQVELPGWFAALNRDFRYQLTCLGQHAPVYIAQEIENNRFRIAGGHPGLRVSWQVTGVRQDPWARAHPFAVEQDKPEDERGFYMEPGLYGEAPEKRMGSANVPRPEPVPAEVLERRPELDDLLERLQGGRGKESGQTEL